MIYYTAILIILIILFFYQYFFFIRVYYTDVALNKFRNLRHEAILNLSIKVKEIMPLEEAKEHQEFIRNLNDSIEHFDKLKFNLIKFRSVKMVYSNIIFSYRKLEKVKKEQCESLVMYKKEFANGVLTLFKAIPFYRVRLSLHLFKVIVSILVGLGLFLFKKNLGRLEKLYNIEKDILNNNSCLS